MGVVRLWGEKKKGKKLKRWEGAEREVQYVERTGEGKRRGKRKKGGREEGVRNPLGEVRGGMTDPRSGWRRFVWEVMEAVRFHQIQGARNVLPRGSRVSQI